MCVCVCVCVCALSRCDDVWLVCILIGVLRCGLPPLTVLSLDLQEEWEELGTHMGLQQSHLEHIKMQHLSQTMECCWAIFTDWLDRNLGATWDDLIRTLELASLQWNTIASGLRHYLKSIIITYNYMNNLFP